MIKLSAQNAPNIIQILLKGSDFESQMYMKKYKHLKWALPELNHLLCNVKCSALLPSIAYHYGLFSTTFNSSTFIFTFRSVIKMLSNNAVPRISLCQKQTEIPFVNLQRYKKFSEIQTPRTRNFRSTQLVFWHSNTRQC